MAKRRPPVPLTALKDAELNNRDWRVLLAMSYLRDPGTETCSSSLKAIGRVAGLPETRVSEARNKLSARGYGVISADGRTRPFTFAWDILPGSEEVSSIKPFRAARKYPPSNTSGQRGIIPGSEEVSAHNTSGQRGSIEGGHFRAAGKYDSSIDIQISDSDLIGSAESNENLCPAKAEAILLHYGIPAHFVRQDRALINSWVTQGHSVGQMHRACGRAKTHNASPGPKYIARCLESIAAEDAGTAAANNKIWYETSTGISAKGAEYGIDEERFDAFPQFRHAVMLEALRRDEPGVAEHLSRRREVVA